MHENCRLLVYIIDVLAGLLTCVEVIVSLLGIVGRVPVKARQRSSKNGNLRRMAYQVSTIWRGSLINHA